MPALAVPLLLEELLPDELPLLEELLPLDELLLLLDELLLEELVLEELTPWTLEAIEDVSEALSLPPQAASAKHSRTGTAIFAFIGDLSWVAGGVMERHGTGHF